MIYFAKNAQSLCKMCLKKIKMHSIFKILCIFYINKHNLITIKYIMEDRLREIDEENVIWIIYLGIIALSYYANYKEVKYLMTNNQKKKEESRKWMIMIFTILVIVYFHFNKGSYDSINKLVDTDTEKKKTLTYASFIASLLVLISGILFLTIIILDEDIDVEIAFN